jgi:hypothetical protein
MADGSHETMVFYELLEDLESQFEDVEVEISRCNPCVWVTSQRIAAHHLLTGC